MKILKINGFNKPILAKLLPYFILSLFLFACSTPTDKNKSSGAKQTTLKDFIGTTWDLITDSDITTYIGTSTLVASKYNSGDVVVSLEVLDDGKVNVTLHNDRSNTIGDFIKSDNLLQADGNLDSINITINDPAKGVIKVTPFKGSLSLNNDTTTHYNYERYNIDADLRAHRTK